MAASAVVVAAVSVVVVAVPGSRLSQRDRRRLSHRAWALGAVLVALALLVVALISATAHPGEKPFAAANRSVFLGTLGWIVAASSAALVWVGLVYVAFGREFRVAGVPDRLAEPPAEYLSPLLAASLTAQMNQPRGEGLTATIFDLVRRGYYTTLPATSGKDGNVVDIALRISGKRPRKQLSEVERAVIKLIDPVLQRGAVATRSLGDEMSSDPARARRNFTAYRIAAASEIGEQRWHTSGLTAGQLLLAPAVLLSLLTFATLGSLGEIPAPERARDAGWAIAEASAALILARSLFERRLLVRRRRHAAELGANWDAFRRYLEDNGGLANEQPASLPLWGDWLVYSIAFGCATDIAQHFVSSGIIEVPEGQATLFGNYSDPGHLLLLGHSIAAAAMPAKDKSDLTGGKDMFLGGLFSKAFGRGGSDGW